MLSDDLRMSLPCKWRLFPNEVLSKPVPVLSCFKDLRSDAPDFPRKRRPFAVRISLFGLDIIRGCGLRDI